MMRKVTVREHERAFLIRHGKYVRALNPGTHNIIDWSGDTAVERHNIVNAEVRPETAMILTKRKPHLASQFFDTVTTDDGELAVISFGGIPTTIQGPLCKRSYWKVLSNVDAQVIKASRNLKIEKKYLNLISGLQSPYVASAVVNEKQAGLLFVDGEYKETLKPGRHAFWSLGQDVTISVVNLHPLPYEVQNEEALTKDRVTVHLTASAMTKVVSPKKLTGAVPEYTDHLHRLLQVALRDAVSSRTLDQLLDERAQIDKEIAKHVYDHWQDIGVEVSEITLKQVLLPNDMRDLLNKVVEAKKNAEASRIRSEETEMSTKKLVENANLMNENNYLLRLKQIEVLDKLADKMTASDFQSNRSTVKVEQVFDALMRFDDWQKQETVHTPPRLTHDRSSNSRRSNSGESGNGHANANNAKGGRKAKVQQLKSANRL